MSRRTSSLSTLTTVPVTMSPSSNSTMVPAMASSKEFPSSSPTICRKTYSPPSSAGMSVVVVEEAGVWSDMDRDGLCRGVGEDAERVAGRGSARLLHGTARRAKRPRRPRFGWHGGRPADDVAPPAGGERVVAGGGRAGDVDRGAPHQGRRRPVAGHRLLADGDGCG